MPSPTSSLVLATRNKGKIAELGVLLADFQLEILGLDAFPEIPDIPETGETFFENALIKAKAVAQATGLIAIADDSGLIVDALHGAPGVYSARYAGEPADGDPRPQDVRNNEKLLAAMAGIPAGRRGCRFWCALVAFAPLKNGVSQMLAAEAAWEGEVSLSPDGPNGFGYDPLFFDPLRGRTAATMDKSEKNLYSHRGQALGKLRAAWPAFWTAVRPGLRADGFTEKKK
jgi:XTP/dITP diphosphohydrolase